MALLQCIRSIGSALVRPMLGAERSATKLPAGTILSRACSYDAYPKMDENPDPYKPKIRRRMGYKQKMHVGGVLPRPGGEEEDTPVGGWRTQPIDWKKRDQWTKKKALFGQNDYIDILGDGSIHPYQLMQGPPWLRGFKGNELQRLVRRLKFEGRFLQDMYPTKYLDLRKQIFFLYKKLNTRRKAPFWSGDNPYRNSRFLRTKERFR